MISRYLLRRRLWLSGVLALGLVVVASSPAQSSHDAPEGVVGAGTHVGQMTVGAATDRVTLYDLLAGVLPTVPPPLDQISRNVLLCHKSTLEYTGAGNAAVTINGHTYAGPINVFFRVPDAWQHFQGTVPGGDPQGCLTPKWFYPVEKATINGTTGVTELHCNDLKSDAVAPALPTLSGYARLLVEHEVYVGGRCDIKDAAGATWEDVQVDMEGVTVVPPVGPGGTATVAFAMDFREDTN